MPKLLVGIAALFLVGFVVRMVAIGELGVAANDATSLAMLKPPPGFVDVIGKQDCPVGDFCYRTSGLLQPITRQNASALLAQFGLTVSNIGCRFNRTASRGRGLACTGEGTTPGLNTATVQVFFSVLSEPAVGPNLESSAQASSGTNVVFGTKALKRLPLVLRFA